MAAITATVPRIAGRSAFVSDLSWKIFVDRYTQKDPARAFHAGDLAVVTTMAYPTWPQKDIARVLGRHEDMLTASLLTGPDAGANTCWPPSRLYRRRWTPRRSNRFPR
jgi:hypothetical protein